MAYSIFQDMTEIDNNPDKWINHGRNVLEESCIHMMYKEDEICKEDDDLYNGENKVSCQGYCEECDILENSAIPIMNYIYPLELNSFDEDKILKVVKETNCTILQNSETNEYFLALCGGGMDLSQDIAYAYLILETQIPFDLLTQVISQKEFSIGKEQWQNFIFLIY